ncbi:hypothetical protein [Phytomonospora endophytica]|uniref:Uncharacterized protein n=1 Tax=Phytomonospora endophytica TaxID=714109 RepID=A0A841FSE8_9ACTN|nr:hypothetical protein [Phytomonospora endophytica]MBB6038724.1 hypothetical protein [Phytomonospora endophytica]GIG68480.1 hypothetical protein Pen01_47750 [Phytomonospora endophytica]
MPVPARDVVGLAVDGVATPDLYRGNAFRLSGLPTTASARDLSGATAGVRATLADPVRRLVHEWFWLWPGRPASPAVALHNRAVVAHYAAVEADPGEADGRAERWAAAYLCWHDVLAVDDCWDRLRERAAAIGDPRAGAAEVDALREVLPQALLTVHARLAVASVADPGVVEVQVRSLRRSGFGERVIDTALRTAVAARAECIRAAVEHLRGEPHGEAMEHALTIADGEDLHVLRTVLGGEHELTAGIADELAAHVRARVVAEINATRGDRPARRAAAVRAGIGHLEAAAALAVGARAKVHIGQDLAVVVNNLVVAMCDQALEDGEARPGEGLALHDRLLRNTRAHVARVDRLDAEAADRLRDDVVGTSLVLLFKYATVTRDVPATLVALRRLQGAATGVELRAELAEAIHALDTVLASPGHGPAIRSGPCASCGGRAGDHRPVHLTGPGRARTPVVTVRLPSCRACADRPIGTAGHRLIAGAAMAAAAGVAVVGGIATGFTFDGLAAPIAGCIGVAVLAGGLSARRRARRAAIARHPEVRALLGRGHHILR